MILIMNTLTYSHDVAFSFIILNMSYPQVIDDLGFDLYPNKMKMFFKYVF